jgi:hypothetical protein
MANLAKEKYIIDELDSSCARMQTICKSRSYMTTDSYSIVQGRFSCVFRGYDIGYIHMFI